MLTKKDLTTVCARLGVHIPDGMAKKDIAELIRVYYDGAAVCDTPDGADFLRTEKKTNEYFVEFEMRGYLNISAESEELAREWVEDHCSCIWSPHMELVRYYGEITEIYVLCATNVDEEDLRFITPA